MINRCVSCRFWTTLGDNSRLGKCSSEKLLRGYDVDDKDIPPGGALIEDDEGWGIFTDGEFGCVNWQAAEFRLAPAVLRNYKINGQPVNEPEFNAKLKSILDPK